jgi:hypothetical protein
LKRTTDEVIGGRSVANYRFNTEGKFVPMRAMNANDEVEI